MFETQVLPFSDETKQAAEDYPRLKKLLDLRTMTSENWIERYASGTLRKNKRLGMRWYKQYRTERVAWEFGYPFAMCSPTRITFSDAITAGDCSAITEAGWHIDRYIEKSLFPEDIWTIKYIKAEPSTGKNSLEPVEGIGVICKTTSAAWLPKKQVVYAIVAEYDPVSHSFNKTRSI